MDRNYETLVERYEAANDVPAAPVKMWTRGVPIDEGSHEQLLKTAQMPFIFQWLAVMPDVHYGRGHTM